jgi:SPP1 gp7 family putative phage head morphogenesis protein
MWEEEQREQLYANILAGGVSAMSLPVSLYEDIAKTIEGDIFDGYGKRLIDVDLNSPDYETLVRMKKNTYVWSAAKTFQQVKDMQSFVFDENGFKRPFRDFKSYADDIFDTYNVNWLRTERETAVAAAQNASRWQTFQNERDQFPYLRYITAGDQRVRPSHADLDGIVKHIDDPFWDQYMPPNGFNCRCEVLSDTGDGLTPTPIRPHGLEYMRMDNGTVIKRNPKLFQMNPGRDKLVFDPSVHPYFNVSKRFRVHKNRNFGLPLPKDVRGLDKYVRRTRPITQ